MNALRIEIERSQTDIWCSKCLDLGISDPTILRGTAYYKVSEPIGGHAHPRIRFLCHDCANRGRMSEFAPEREIGPLVPSRWPLLGFMLIWLGICGYAVYVLLR